jgi:WD40 repeat protein
VAASGGWYDEANGILRAFDAATGQQLLDNTKIPARVSGVSLSRDGNILAAAADKVYVYKRSGSGYISLNPADSSWDMDGSVKAVAVHPDGSWLVGCDMKGNVLMVTLAGGKVQGTHDWQAPEQPIDRINNPTALAPLPFLSVAIAGESDIFAVGGGDFVYLFTKKGMIQKQPKTEFDTWDGNAPAGRQNGGAAQNVRWLALSAKGELLAVVANREINKQGTGVLLAYRQGGGQPDWRLELPRNPNGISTDAAGNYVGVADGYPLGDPAAFFMFDSDGQELWHYPTIDMNWPIAISANGKGIAAGGDDGILYYFKP